MSQLATQVPTLDMTCAVESSLHDVTLAIAMLYLWNYRSENCSIQLPHAHFPVQVYRSLEMHELTVCLPFDLSSAQSPFECHAARACCKVHAKYICSVNTIHTLQLTGIINVCSSLSQAI